MVVLLLDDERQLIRDRMMYRMFELGLVDSEDRDMAGYEYHTRLQSGWPRLERRFVLSALYDVVWEALWIPDDANDRPVDRYPISKEL